MFSLDIKQLPQEAGVYQFKDAEGTILYIGKAKNLQKRISQYFAKHSVWKQEMLAKASKIDFFVVENEGEALYLENNLIKQYKPFYNTLLKGGNGYSYLKITADPFPQVLITRMKKEDGATYL